MARISRARDPGSTEIRFLLSCRLGDAGLAHLDEAVHASPELEIDVRDDLAVNLGRLLAMSRRASPLDLANFPLLVPEFNLSDSTSTFSQLRK